MASKRTDRTTRALKLNLAAMGALLAAIALVAYAAASSDANRPRLGLDLPQESDPCDSGGGAEGAGGAGRSELRLALTLPERREIFVDVLADHSTGAGAHEACELVAWRRGLGADVVVQVVREGVRRGWPRE